VIYSTFVITLQKTMAGLHEDLQYDYQQELDELLMKGL